MGTDRKVSGGKSQKKLHGWKKICGTENFWRSVDLRKKANNQNKT